MGCPKSVIKLYCSYNKLTSLAGCPKSVIKLYCSYNKLTSLVGCPTSVTTLNCGNNKLKSLVDCPSSVTKLDCYNNRLTSLVGCPEQFLHKAVVELNKNAIIKTFKQFEEQKEEIRDLNTLPGSEDYRCALANYYELKKEQDK